VRPVRPSDRGSAVEDIQRRLLTLGYDLGPTGVDGVFLGATLSAVTDFQTEHRLAEDGIVGPETWSRLVDETFTLGDRLLYLRFPYLHGRDVAELQGALNALGFACGEPDGILGPLTERAAREFQRNTGLPEDGIAGSETVGALRNIEHVWRDKEPRTPFGRQVEPARSAEGLARETVAVVYADEQGCDLAFRLASTARAACEGSKLVDVAQGRPLPEARVVLRLVPEDVAEAPGVPVVEGMSDPATLAARIFAAVASAPRGGHVIYIVPREADDHALQRMAVGLLDGLCAALSAPENPML
jgi:peptidoglycan hydrolase-like protein with peptidoglycan-binding domain